MTLSLFQNFVLYPKQGRHWQIWLPLTERPFDFMSKVLSAGEGSGVGEHLPSTSSLTAQSLQET